jgi:predicted DNA-binding transcriptional regulator YafY
MRADRLVTILLLLQQHGRLPVRELAARLEVSDRTVTRDLEALSVAGVPVYAERGRHGGWSLAEDYRTDLTGLSADELRGLIVATAPSVLADLGLGQAAERALVKVLAGLPAARRLEAESARRYLHVDPGGWRRTDEVSTHLATLDEALRRGRRLWLAYERAFDKDVVERTVDPLGLVAKGSTWYLVAAVDGSERTYRASRIREARILDEPAVRPDGFDLPSFWASSRQEFEAQLPRHYATIRAAPAAMARIRGGFWRYAKIVQESDPDDDGWVRCRIQGDSVDALHDYVLGLGGRAEVIEPASLAEAILESARAVVTGGTTRLAGATSELRSSRSSRRRGARGRPGGACGRSRAPRAPHSGERPPRA